MSQRRFSDFETFAASNGLQGLMPDKSFFPRNDAEVVEERARKFGALLDAARARPELAGASLREFLRAGKEAA